MFAELQALEIKEMPPDVYNGLKLLLVVQGTVSTHVSQESYTLQRNDMLLVNRNELHSVAGAQGNAVLQLCIPFEYLQQEGPELLAYAFSPRPDTTGHTASAGDELRQLLYYMLIVQHYQREGFQLELRANLFRLMHLLLQHFKLHPTETRELSNCTDPNIQAVVTAIHEQYRSPLTLEQMAKRQYLSKHYLSRLFKEQTGVGFLEYLTRVRLESARKDLLYTGDSVIQIALRNGFPSAQAFAAHFKRLYGATPTDYRTGSDKFPTAAQSRCHAIPFEQLCGLSEIAKHLGGYEQDGSSAVAEFKISATAATAPFSLCDRVVKVGRMGNLLRGEVRSQLVQAQEKINFQYVHFLGIFFDGIDHCEFNSLYWGCPYAEIFPFLERLGLCPILRIDIGLLHAAGISPEQAESTLLAFLTYVSMNFTDRFTAQWLYELFSPATVPPEARLLYQQTFYRAIKRHSSASQVGVSLEWSGSEHTESTSRFLGQCILSACPPDFITLCADPNPGYRNIDNEHVAEQYIRSFYTLFFRSLRGVLTRHGFAHLPLFLLEWNTLVGENLLECASFFRAALIAEALLQFQQANVVPAFWLSEHASETFLGVFPGVLSLFHCMDLKRSIFYLLQLYTKLGSQLLFSSDGFLATIDSKGRYALLGYNSCRFRPIHSMDFDFVKQHQRNISALLSNVPGGGYQIKTFRLAMNFSYAVNDRESIHRLPNINVQHYYSDPDSLDYLSAIAAPQYALFQEHIEEHCLLHFDLPFNALKLYLIDRL